MSADLLELPFAEPIHLKPLAVYSLACLVKHVDTIGTPAITSDVVCALRWSYARHHEHGTVSRRLSELHEAGMIEPTGSKRVSELTHAAQTEWLPTPTGRAFLADRKPS